MSENSEDKDVLVSLRRGRLQLRSLFENVDSGDGEASEMSFSGATELGTHLRAAREARSVSLAQAADALRIRERNLAAIESGQLDQLPGYTYAVGFVRSYADYLGLDGDALVEDFKNAVNADLPEGAALSFPRPESDAVLPKGSLVAVGVVVLALMYGSWHFLVNQDGEPPGRVDELPPGLATLVGDLPEEAGPEPDGEQASAAMTGAPEKPDGAKPAEEISEEISSDTVAEVAPKTLPETAAETVADKPDAAPALTAAPIAAPAPVTTAKNKSAPKVGRSETTAKIADVTASRVMLRARSDVWVEVAGSGPDGNRQVFISRILKAGEVFRPPAFTGLQLSAGNAGALEVIVDGTRLVDLGPRGATLQAVPLNPESLRRR